jgi:dipeptidyl aminopeptidase/acylaminoacyl peptidase
MKKFITIMLVAVMLCGLVGCVETTTAGSRADVNNTINAANNIQSNQATPTDLNYSLERYNLIRRAYWVNGQRERANTHVCEIEKPLGYVVLFSGNTVVGSFVVDGKVSSLNSYLTPDSEYYEYNTGATATCKNNWLADVDGSYGTNDNGIFFFTPDGKYIEWTGTYIYSDIPFTVDNPVVNYEVNE